MGPRPSASRKPYAVSATTAHAYIRPTHRVARRPKSRHHRTARATRASVCIQPRLALLKIERYKHGRSRLAKKERHACHATSRNNTRFRKVFRSQGILRVSPCADANACCVTYGAANRCHGRHLFECRATHAAQALRRAATGCGESLIGCRDFRDASAWGVATYSGHKLWGVENRDARRGDSLDCNERARCRLRG